MLTCKVCGTQQLHGTIFCAECGASLVSQDDETSLGEPSPRIDSSLLSDGPLKPVGDGILHLFIVSSGRHLDVHVNRELTIGRRDKNNQSIPDIDFADDDGYEKGVSRKHAALAIRQGEYVLKDLGSSNGTFVNHSPLVPHEYILLQHGDKITFGTLQVKVSY
jgi:pSer/pThr/pTyr-binding forkhead associated (FHA) protein